MKKYALEDACQKFSSEFQKLHGFKAEEQFVLLRFAYYMFKDLFDFY